MADQATLLRVAVVAGVITVDPDRRAPGRGAYLHADPACLATAVKRRALPRALRTTGPLADDLAERLVAHAKSGETR